ncbi:MAG TPA: carboxypeptidase-like regulatory domain-containing protein [Candidatus Sulfotelmatobacter sp.]|nr:carboxypeptidase-like regulatory domain-containing protein [Candidatus Sulfotelmatobacter sp.]
MKLFVALTVVAASLTAYSQTKLPGEIKGTVTDATGAPISGATVYAVSQNTGFSDATLRSAKSDRNGMFDFRGGFALGSYKLYSRKDEDSYPDPLDKFYADPQAEAQAVELTAAHPSATATVTLGQQAAVLAGKIVDAITGDAIRASLAFVDGQGNGHSISVDGDYRILVPPGKDVTLMVTAMGARSNRAQIPVAPLRLEPGQHVYMDLSVRQ